MDTERCFPFARLASCLVACSMFLAAHAWAAAGASVMVIPPGVEPLVIAMVGGDAHGAPLAASCVFTGAAIDRSRILARYICAGRPVTLDLRHPSDPDADHARAHTGQFALLADDGAPPTLIDDVATRIRAHEAEWHWVSAETNAPNPSDNASSRDPVVRAGDMATPPPDRFFASPRSFGGAALVIAALATLLERLTRRRAERDRSLRDA